MERRDLLAGSTALLLPTLAGCSVGRSQSERQAETGIRARNSMAHYHPAGERHLTDALEPGGERAQRLDIVWAETAPDLVGPDADETLTRYLREDTGRTDGTPHPPGFLAVAELRTVAVERQLRTPAPFHDLRVDREVDALTGRLRLTDAAVPPHLADLDEVVTTFVVEFGPRPDPVPGSVDTTYYEPE
jgi:hypothetical protein